MYGYIKHILVYSSLLEHLEPTGHARPRIHATRRGIPIEALSMHICVYMCIFHMHACVCLYIYIYIYIFIFCI